jgi:hypothetical protein
MNQSDSFMPVLQRFCLQHSPSTTSTTHVSEKFPHQQGDLLAEQTVHSSTLEFTRSQQVKRCIFVKAYGGMDV